MHFLIHIIKLKDGETISWRLMKVSLMLIWLMFIRHILSVYNDIPLPAGVCSIFPCDFFKIDIFRSILIPISYILSFLYIFEYRMKLTTFLIFIFTIFTFSFEESNGIYGRTAILTSVFGVQFIAYILKGKKYADPILFSRQIIAAAYTLAGISKLTKTGITWPLDAPYLLLQIKKGAYYSYFNNGDTTFLDSQNIIIKFFTDHPYLLLISLFSVFLLELCSFIILVNNKTAFAYGILLLLMHIGIWYTMDIIIYYIVYPMVIILLNPLDLIYKSVVALNKFSPKKYLYR